MITNKMKEYFLKRKLRNQISDAISDMVGKPFNKEDVTTAVIAQLAYMVQPDTIITGIRTTLHDGGMSVDVTTRVLPARFTIKPTKR